MKIGIIDVGGGLRDIYGVGVLDRLMEEGVSFDHAIGVSAGSANLASFLAGQKGRNYRFYTEYAFRKEYMSLRNLVWKHNYVDLDYVYGALSVHDGEYPIDFKHFHENPCSFTVVATDAFTGQPKYFTKADIPFDCYDALKCSSCLPGVCQPYAFEGSLYYDGALSDSIPLDWAFQEGADRVVLILSLPTDQRKVPDMDEKIAKLIRRKYPLAATKLCARASLYNSGVAKALALEKEGKVLIVAPKNTFGVRTLSKDKEDLEKLYREGYEDAAHIVSSLKEGSF